VTVLLVAVGAAVGAPLRWLAGRWGRRGTLLVNLAGCFVLGLVARSSPVPAALVGTGFCGALTTYSTFSWELLTLGERRQIGLAVGYGLVSTAGGLGAAALGWWIG
jgi:fluoride exporter